jgi:GTP-binding protein
MVRTSRTPGRTQLLNLFVLDERLALVDLPGYGYAKLAKHKRSALEALMRSYLAWREPLRGVVLLLDARREAVSELDRRFAEWSLEAKRALLVAITKIDLVPKPRRLHQARRIEEDLGIPASAAVLCSARTGEGRQELSARLLELGS